MNTNLVSILRIDVASLAIGAGIGVVVAIVLAAFFVFRLGETQLQPESDTSMIFIRSNNTHFFMDGLIKEISAKRMVIDQTFNHTEYNDNPNVTIRLDRGAEFVNCYDKKTGQSAQKPEACSQTITDDDISKGLYVCGLTRMYNGEFYAGKTWLNSSCGPFQHNTTGLANGDNKVSAVSCQPFSLCTYNINKNNTIYPINFRFNGTIENMTADLQTNTLSIRLIAESTTSLQIAIPREVVDARTEGNGISGADDDLVVFTNQIPTDDVVREFSTKEGTWAKDLGISDNPEKYRILEIHIEQGTESVDIVGTMPI